MRIDDIINRKIEPESFNRREPRSIEIEAPLSLDSLRREDVRSERRAFNYLLENKGALGISRIYQLKNSVVDGQLELNSGKTILLEIKYALNWARSCQARLQFQRFLIDKLYDKLSIKRPESALIVFHHFSGDWARKGSKNRKYLDGWNNFYEEENSLSKGLIKTDIAQLIDAGRLIPYPGVLA